MPKRTVRDTIRKNPDAVPDASAALAATPSVPTPLIAPRVRRERTIREILDSGRDPLRELARLMAESSDPSIRLQAAKALAPFMFPVLRAAELSGPDGEPLTVEIRTAG